MCIDNKRKMLTQIYIAIVKKNVFLDLGHCGDQEGRDILVFE
jgi:hypothetical protein